MGRAATVFAQNAKTHNSIYIYNTQKQRDINIDFRLSAHTHNFSRHQMSIVMRAHVKCIAYQMSVFGGRTDINIAGAERER